MAFKDVESLGVSVRKLRVGGEDFPANIIQSRTCEEIRASDGSTRCSLCGRIIDSGELPTVTLRVGQERFRTQLSTLRKRDAGSRLDKLAQRQEDLNDKKAKTVCDLHAPTIFIDRDSTHFRHILNYLRDGTAVLPPDVFLLRQVKGEAAYYGLTGLLVLLSEELSQLANQPSRLSANSDVSGCCLAGGTGARPDTCCLLGRDGSSDTVVAAVAVVAAQAAVAAANAAAAANSREKDLQGKGRKEVFWLSELSHASNAFEPEIRPPTLTRTTLTRSQTLEDVPSVRGGSFLEPGDVSGGPSRARPRSATTNEDNLKTLPKFTANPPSSVPLTHRMAPGHWRSVKFEWTEIQKHNNEESCWLVVKNIVYDVTSFVNVHPAGKTAILRHAGTDATVDYNFHPGSAQKIWHPYRIGRAAGSQCKTLGAVVDDATKDCCIM